MRNNNIFLEDGIVLLNKSKGMTSFAAINKLKWLLNAKKIGHAGTLDPIAEGLLVVMINNATKFSNDLMKKDKEYYVEMELGYETDSYDADGEITKKYEKDFEFEFEKIKEVVESFLGEIDQIPPMYSAIKVNGKKLYELARKGVEIDRKHRKVNINYINDIKYKNNKISFFVGVSSGTYIRSLVRDIGEKLGVYGTMTKLVRTKINNYSFTESIELKNVVSYFEKNQVEKKSEEKENLYLIENIKKIINFIEIKEIFDYPEIKINEDIYMKLKNGMTILLEKKENSKNYKINEKFKIILEKNNEFKGIVNLIKVCENKVYLKRDKYFK